MSREGMNQGDIGWSNLPERGYVSKRVMEVLKESPGIEITTLQVWNQIGTEARRLIADSYGDASKGRRAVHKSLVNLKGLHGNPRKVKGSGDASTVWLYTGPRAPRLPKDGDVVYTTETPEPDKPRTASTIQEELDAIDRHRAEAIDRRRKKDRDEFKDYDIPATPIDETFGPKPKPEPDMRTWGDATIPSEPQVGDMSNFTIVGKLSDGSFLWRKEDDGTLGFIEFNTL